MSEAIASQAWEATKEKSDPSWSESERDHRERLTYQAERAIETGVTSNPFEEEVVKLNNKAAATAAK